MQRLFTIFPNGVPGLGLLLLRCGAGIIALWHSLSVGVSLSGPELPLLISGVLLVIGLWTPIAAVCFAIASAWIMGGFLRAETAPFAWLVLGIGLAMLGPGAWSIDSRLFGRKRINLNPRQD